MLDLFAERYGFGPWDLARMTPTEIQLYQVGMQRREEQKERSSNQRTGVSQDQKRREEEALRQYA